MRTCAPTTALGATVPPDETEKKITILIATCVRNTGQIGSNGKITTNFSVLAIFAWLRMYVILLVYLCAPLPICSPCDVLRGLKLMAKLFVGSVRAWKNGTMYTTPFAASATTREEASLLATRSVLEDYPKPYGYTGHAMQIMEIIVDLQEDGSANIRLPYLYEDKYELSALHAEGGIPEDVPDEGQLYTQKRKEDAV